MGDYCEEASAGQLGLEHAAKSEPIEDVTTRVTSEWCCLVYKIRKLKAAIEADPASVSDDHKAMWKQQLAYMEGYKNVLADRIKDMLEQV